MTVASFQLAVCSALNDFSTPTQTKVIRAFYNGKSVQETIAKLRK